MRDPAQPRRIAVAGVFDIANYGDQLFPLIAAWRLSPHGIGVEAVAPGPPDRLRSDARVPRDLDWLLTDSAPLDGILIGGGNILYNLRTDYLQRTDASPRAGASWLSGGMHTGLWLGACLAAALRDIPFGFNAPGLPYPFSTGVARGVLGPCLDAADLVALRDTASRRLAEPAGIPTECVPDTAADLARMWPRAGLEGTLRGLAGRLGRDGWPGERYAAIHLRAEPSAGDAAAEAAFHLDAFCAAHGLRPVLVAIGDDLGDGDTIGRLAPLMRSDPVILDGSATLQEVAAVIAHAAIYLGGSLHGYITAAAYDVPGIIVTRQPHRKFGGFLEWIDRPADLAHDWEEGCTLGARRLARREGGTGSPLVPPTVGRALDAHWARVRAMLDHPERKALQRAALLRMLTGRAAGKAGLVWAMAPWRRACADGMQGRASAPEPAPTPRPVHAAVSDAGPGTASSTIADVLHAHALRRPEAPAMLVLVRGERPGESDTYGSLDGAARRIGGALRAAGLAGHPVLLACSGGLSFVRAFLGCLYAGAYAVPVPAVLRNSGGERLRQIARDARPAAVLADDEAVLEILGPHAVPFIDVMRAQEDGPALAGPCPSGAIAFIQYTSGSTGSPKGVVVTHDNIMANQAMIRDAFAHDAHTVVASWLPLHHDMGLVGSILQPLYLGGRCILMSPLDFLQRPIRWLRAIAEYRATTSGAPNFAYELCLRQITPAQAERLDLSSWRLAFCGSEPVRAGTMERFADRFAPAGFEAGALYPCYGLAEATLFATGGTAGDGARHRHLARSGFAAVSTAVAAEQPVVACGRAHGPARVAVVPPGEARHCPPGTVGEICVAGPHVSPGLWSPGEAEGIRPHGDRTITLDGMPYLRTGDAGLMVEDALHVVGRLKDMVILRGANIHAEDVEATLLEQPEAHGLEAAAAIAVERDFAEILVVLCEPSAAAARAGLPDRVARTLRQRIAQVHGVQPAELVLLTPRGLPRTTSGKVQRGAARAAWLEGRLTIGRWRADASEAS